ncbi:radical SAM protein [bacterium]|nr:radical SAM protein [bacterium]
MDFSKIAKNSAKWALGHTLWCNAAYHPRPEDRPFYIRLDVTNFCNQACVKCWVPDAMRRQKPYFMPLDDYKILAERLFGFTYLLQVPCAFEGLMHPHFAELIRIADDYGIPNIGVVTNGVLLKGDKAEALIASRHVTGVNVSIDALDPEIYRYMRGRHEPQTVLANVEAFLDRKRQGARANLHLKFNSILARSNARDLPNLARWARDHQIDEMEFFHVEPFDRSNEESLLNEPDTYKKLHDELGAILAGGPRVFLPPPFEPGDFDADGNYVRRHTQDAEASAFDTSESNTLDPRYSHPYPKDVFCINPWMVLQIDCRGDIFPCAHRIDLPPLANILRQDRDEAINSLRFMKLRRGILSGNFDETCRRCCSRAPSADPMKRRQVRILHDEK